MPFFTKVFFFHNPPAILAMLMAAKSSFIPRCGEPHDLVRQPRAFSKEKDNSRLICYCSKRPAGLGLLIERRSWIRSQSSIEIPTRLEMVVY